MEILNKKRNKVIATGIIMSLIVFFAAYTTFNHNNSAIKAADKPEVKTVHKKKQKKGTIGDQQLNMIIENGKPSIVYFTSQFCRSCQQVKEIIKELEKEYEGKVDFLVVDIRANDSLTKAAMKKYRVLGVPMTIFVKKDGTKQKVFADYYPKENFENQVKILLEN